MTMPNELTREQVVGQLELIICNPWSETAQIKIAILAHDATLRASKNAAHDALRYIERENLEACAEIDALTATLAAVERERDLLNTLHEDVAQDRLRLQQQLQARDATIAELQAVIEAYQKREELHQGLSAQVRLQEINEGLALENAGLHITNDGLVDRLARLEGLYNELIVQVGNKFPDESRHQTAKRYIQQHENECGQGGPVQAQHALEGEPTASPPAV